MLFTGQAQAAGTIFALRDSTGDTGRSACPAEGAPPPSLGTSPPSGSGGVGRGTGGTISAGGTGNQRPRGRQGHHEPWKNKLGAWGLAYAMERARAEHQQVLQYEQDLDAVNARIRELTANHGRR